MKEISRTDADNQMQRHINADDNKDVFEFVRGHKKSKEFTRLSIGKIWDFSPGKWWFFSIEIDDVSELRSGTLRRTSKSFELYTDEAIYLRDCLNKFLAANGK